MKKPLRYGFVDIAIADLMRWRQTGSLSDVMITVWDFDTLAEMRSFAAGAVPSGYCSQAFERVRIRWDRGWVWDETEIEMGTDIEEHEVRA